MCYSFKSACFQRLKLKYDKLVSNFAFNFNLRRYIKVIGDPYVQDEDKYDYVTPPDGELTVPGRDLWIVLATSYDAI